MSKMYKKPQKILSIENREIVDKKKIVLVSHTASQNIIFKTDFKIFIYMYNVYCMYYVYILCNTIKTSS